MNPEAESVQSGLVSAVSKAKMSDLKESLALGDKGVKKLMLSLFERSL